MPGNYMDNFLDWLESTTPEERLVHPRRPWPYDGPEGRARLTGSLGTGRTGEDGSGPTPGKFRVTLRIERPDGQFVTSTREVPANLLSPAGGADDGTAQDWAVRDIGAAFVSAYRRAAELPE